MIEQVLDVSDLEPCEPLERILATIPNLQAGEYLRVLHRMEPQPLYPILKQKGYAWLTKEGQNVQIEVYIWRNIDAQAEAAARSGAKLV
jgi:uncharacterized protein (DUF2249 family)